MANESKELNGAGQGGESAELEPTLHYRNPTLQRLAAAFPQSAQETPDFDDEPTAPDSQT